MANETFTVAVRVLILVDREVVVADAVHRVGRGGFGVSVAAHHYAALEGEHPVPHFGGVDIEDAGSVDGAVLLERVRCSTLMAKRV